MIVKINKVDTFSVAKILGCLQAFIGLVTGLVLTMISIVNPDSLEAGQGVEIFGVWSFIVLPVLNGLLGFLSGMLVGYVYNVSAKFLGIGIKMDIENT